MRIVRSAEEYDDAVAAAGREAAAAFGDDTLLIEKYVERGRHIEVQVLADTHGNVRPPLRARLLDPAPAPEGARGGAGPDHHRRAARGSSPSSAVALAREVGYVNAGTVEFLLDTETGEAYFLEMNTRLQVEHPVTEAVVTVAGGRSTWSSSSCGSPPASSSASPRTTSGVAGHAIEARVYAEDAFGGFLPQAGTATLVRWPAGDAIRVDHALESGQVVSTSYDPMLGKVIASGPDRESARRALVAALDETAILGLTTNVGFLRELAASDAFRDATIDTAWLDRHERAAPDRRPGPPGRGLDRCRGDPPDEHAAGPFAPDGWRLGAEPAPIPVDLDRVVVVDRHRGTASDGDRVIRMATLEAADHTVLLEVDGARVRAVVNADRHAVEVSLRGQRFVFERADAFADHGVELGDGTVVGADARHRARGARRGGRPRRGRPDPGHHGGDEDGARAQGPVRRHGRRRSAPPSASRSRSAPGCSSYARTRRRHDRGIRHAVPGGGLPERVTIYEVGPRDGLQNESELVPTEVKVEFVRRLLAAGLPVVEATSFVHPRWVPQLADAEDLLTALATARDLPVLVPNERGLDRALELGCRHIAIFGSATETFAQRNLNRSLDEQFAMFEPVVRRALAEGVEVRAYLSMCFGDPWEGAVPRRPGRRRRPAPARPRRRPAQHRRHHRRRDRRPRPGADPRLRRRGGRASGGWRCTSTTPTARRSPTPPPPCGEGITTFDASAGGLGGCPYAHSATGNLATEDLVWMLHGLGIETGVDLDALVATSVWLAGRLGRPSPSAVVRALGSPG